jgi:hypothetical protein
VLHLLQLHAPPGLFLKMSALQRPELAAPVLVACALHHPITVVPVLVLLLPVATIITVADACKLSTVT